MMNRPPINELEQKAGCRYLLVSAVAKRARQLLSKADKPSDDVALAIAVEEIDSDKLTIKQSSRSSVSILD